MACHLFGTSHHLNQYWLVIDLTLSTKYELKYNTLHVFENVVHKMAAILSQPQSVKWLVLSAYSFLSLLLVGIVNQHLQG